MNDKAKPEPAARQFQGRDGVWHNFIDERHLQNTVEDGSWPLRNLYTQEAIDTLRAEIATLRAENESLREQRNHIGLCIGHALRGGKKDDHEAGLSERMNAIRALIAERNEWRASRIAYANEFPLNADGEPDVVNVHANIRSLKAQLAEAQAALKTVMRNAELSKEPCGPDPESPATIRNDKFAGLASIAAQGLGMVRGPSLTEHLVEAQKDAERLDWIIEHRAYVVSDPDCCDGYWLNYARPDGTMWTQATEHETPRAAIDAAKGESTA